MWRESSVVIDDACDVCVGHLPRRAVVQRSPRQTAPNAAGWTLPPDADTKKNPLTVDAKVLAAGKSGLQGQVPEVPRPGGPRRRSRRGSGRQEDMDLTNAKRARTNSDGVMFYKVWNGRRKPKMPAFKDELTEEQIWRSSPTRRRCAEK